MHGKHQSSKRAAEARVAEKIEGYGYPDLSQADLDSMRDDSGCGRVADEPSPRVKEIIELRVAALRQWHRDHDEHEAEPWEPPMYSSMPWDFLRDEKTGVVD